MLLNIDYNQENVRVIKGKLKSFIPLEYGAVVEAKRGLDEILIAAHLANVSFKNKSNIGKTIGMEFLLWLNRTRHINKALPHIRERDEVYCVIFKELKEDIEKYLSSPKEIDIGNVSLNINDWKTIEEISLSRIKK